MVILAPTEAKVMSIGFQSSITRILTIVISIIAIAISPLIAVAERPKPPKTGTPSGNTTPGTTRPEISCPVTPKPLTAIVANQGEDFTLEEYPTFLFYIPYPAQKVSLMEFLLLDKTQTHTIYRTLIKANPQAGIIKIQLPPQTGQALAVNNTYYWRFNLDCEPDRTVPDLVVQGWIKRVPITAETSTQLQSAKLPEYLIYQRQGIWYDAIAQLAKSHFTDPNNTQLTQAWNETLESLKIEWLIGEPLVD